MKNLKQLLSITLSATLATTSMPWTGFAVGPAVATAPAFVQTFTPAEQLGYVASSYSPSADVQRPRLIVISDLHGHVEVQHHIVQILDSFVNTLTHSAGQANGKKVPIFVEGGWKANLEEPLRVISNPSVRSFMGEYFLQKAEIGAAQAYSEKVAGSGKVSLIGVENEDEWKANREQFAKTYPTRRSLLQAIHREEVALHSLSQVISNPSFESLQALRNDYEAGRMTPKRYARALLRRASRYGIKDEQVNVLRNLSTATPNQMDVAFFEVYREVSLQSAGGRPLTSFLRRSLGNESDLRSKVARIDAQLDLLKRLVGNQLTPAEVILARARMPELIQIAQLMVGDEQLPFNVSNVVESSLDFYAFAHIRDISLVKNSLSALDASGPDTTGILVAGGFHAEAITQYLRDNQIAYLEVNPSVTRELTSTEQLNYIKRICEEHVTPQELDADISLLKKNGRQLSTAAMGPSNSNAAPEAEQDPGQTKLLANGLTSAAQFNAIVNEGPALQRALENLPAEIATEAVVESAQVAAARSSNVADAIALVNKERGVDLAAGITPEMGSISLGLNSLGQFEQQGAQDTIFTGLLNEGRDILRDSVQGKTIKRIEIQEASDAVMEKLGADAMVADEVDAAGTLVVFMSSTRFKWARNAQRLIATGQVAPGSIEEQGIMRSIHSFAHELFGHHFMKGGAIEETALQNGVIMGAVFATKLFTTDQSKQATEDVVKRFLTAIEPQVGGAFEDWKSVTTSDFVPALAKTVSELIAPEALSQAEVENLVTEMQNKFPNLSEYAIRTKVDELNSSRLTRLMADQPEDLKKKLTEEEEKENTKAGWFGLRA